MASGHSLDLGAAIPAPKQTADTKLEMQLARQRRNSMTTINSVSQSAVTTT